MIKLFKNFKFIFWLSFACFIFFFLLADSTYKLDADMGWHLRVGQQIIKTHDLPKKEIITYPLGEDATWVDHEWLLNVLSYLIYSCCGYFSLQVIFSLIFILLIYILFNITIKFYIKNQDYFLVLPPFLLLGILATMPHLGVRMQVITMLFLVLLINIIENYNHNKNNKTLIWLPLLTWFWASCHGGFLIAFVVLGIWLISIFLFAFFPKTISEKFIIKQKWQKKEFYKVLIFIVFSFLSTLFTPYGPKLYSFLWKYKDTAYLKLISEWMPFYYAPIQYLQIIYLAIVTAVLLISFYNLTNKKNPPKLDIRNIIMVLFFMFLAFSSKRHFPLFFIVSFPWAASYLARDLNIKTKDIKKHLYVPIIKFFLITVLLLGSVNYALKIHINNNPFTSKIFCSYYPCQAVNFLQKNQKIANLKIFNSYNWGGYLSWVWPEKRIFIDGRLPFYPLSGNSFLVEYKKFFSSSTETQNMLNKYKINLVLLQKEKSRLSFLDNLILKKSVVNNKTYDAIDFLRKNNDWRLIYEDEISVIFVKKT